MSSCYAVRFEMLTGKKAFEGKSQLSVASAILEKEPAPISSIKPMTPMTLDHAIRRCLAKDPEERWQTARDFKLELKWVSESGSQVTSTQAIRPGSTRARWRAIALWSVGLLLLAAITGLAIWNLRPVLSKPVSRFVLTLPAGQRLAGLNQPSIALSQDGTLLAYVAAQNGIQRIYLRAMNSLEPRPVPGTEGGVNPFFCLTVNGWVSLPTTNSRRSLSAEGR